MNRPLSLFASVVLLSAGVVRADEGMWRPGQLAHLENDLKRTGVRLDTSRLTDLAGHPMAAVISLGGCTASFVSADGLAVTNHHCALGAIQFNSTPERNLLQTGFLARQKSEELPAGPGSRISVTVQVTDVTKQMQKDLPPGTSGRKRYQMLDDRKKELVAACEKDPGHRCRVATYSGGLEYELIKQLEIRDVRLVHAPAGSIGNYGGDVDNWMWPRHTGDYSFYRAYVGPDGRPADPSQSNVPYRPRHVLKIAREGLTDGSPVMVVGYPGMTNRHRLADEVESTFDWLYPLTTRVNRQMLDIVARETNGRPEGAIRTASLVARLNNTMKNNEGMLAGYAHSGMLERKRREEADLAAWVAQDPARRKRFESSLSGLTEAVAADRALRERGIFYERNVRAGSLFEAARTLVRLSVEQTRPDPDRESGYQERDIPRIKDRLARMERTFDPQVDRALWRQAILDYAAIPAGQHVAPFDDWFGIKGTAVDAAALDAKLDEMYGRTRLGDTATRLSLMKAPPSAELQGSDDPFLQLAARLLESDLALEEQRKDHEGRIEAARAQAMAARIEFLASHGRPLYPDANGTLRVSYGQVRGYRPRDGVVYAPFTVLDGILGKDTGVDPFDAPPAQLEAIRAKRFGSWKDTALDTVPVNFLTTLDISGGNSGSPVLDARGDLVGLAFDGNWESIISGWEFQPETTRCIGVDIRYVLWVMDTIHEARGLLAELGANTTTGASAGR
ncbi:MAG: S46 family peptidase [Candidatus Polarisedimenticolia bacterium]